MDIATISHKSKLSLSKINPAAVRLETLGDSNWRGLISKEHSEALSIYVIFFILLQIFILKHIFHLCQEMNAEYQIKSLLIHI